MGEVGDRRGDDVSAPAIFQCHRDSHFHAEVTSLSCFCQSTEFADLDVHHVHCLLGMSAEERVKSVDVLVENEGAIPSCANSAAFVVGRAGLLDVDINVPNSLADTYRFMLEPARVGIGHKNVTPFQFCGNGVNSRNIEIDIVTANLELEAAVALFAVAGYLGCHFFGRFLRDCSIQLNAVSEATTEEFANRHPGRFAKNIPAGHIDRGFHIGVSFQGDVHASIDSTDFVGGGTKKVRAEFVDAGSCALPEGGEIKWS